MTDRSNRSRRRVPADRRSSASRRAASPRPAARLTRLLPAPVFIAGDAQLGVAILPGEVAGVSFPFVYALAALPQGGADSCIAFDHFSTVPSDLRKVLAAWSGGIEGLDPLMQVIGLLPPLAGADEFDVLSLDLCMTLDGPLTAEQRSRVRGAVRMFHSDAYASGPHSVM